MMHNLAGGRLEFVRSQLWNDTIPDPSSGPHTLFSINPKRNCNSADCKWWDSYTIDTASSLIPYDGYWEFRQHTEVQSCNTDTCTNDARNLATNGWLAYFSNGKTVRNTTTPNAYPQTEGRGWYRNAAGSSRGYENAVFKSQIPLTPVSGTWAPQLQTKAGSGGETITWTTITIDPDFHNGNEGTKIVDQAGAFNGTVSINTLTLTNGVHKLAIIGTADEPDGKLSGVYVVPFDVQN
jgi:hypothetical protein